MHYFRLQEQVDSEKTLCESYLISICVRLFLEKYENDVKAFCEEFRQLTLVDEKYDLLLNFLQSIYSLMRRESMWQGTKNYFLIYKLGFHVSCRSVYFCHFLTLLFRWCVVFQNITDKLFSAIWISCFSRNERKIQISNPYFTVLPKLHFGVKNKKISVQILAIQKRKTRCFYTKNNYITVQNCSLFCFYRNWYREGSRHCRGTHNNKQSLRSCFVPQWRRRSW